MRNRKSEGGTSSSKSSKVMNGTSNKEKLSTEAKAARLKEILERAARRSNEEAQEAAEEQRSQERIEKRGGANDEEEKDLLEKIQRTYEKYLAKK